MAAQKTTGENRHHESQAFFAGIASPALGSSAFPVFELVRMASRRPAQCITEEVMEPLPISASRLGKGADVSLAGEITRNKHFIYINIKKHE